MTLLGTRILPARDSLLAALRQHESGDLVTALSALQSGVSIASQDSLSLRYDATCTTWRIQFFFHRSSAYCHTANSAVSPSAALVAACEERRREHERKMDRERRAHQLAQMQCVLTKDDGASLCVCASTGSRNVLFSRPFFLSVSDCKSRRRAVANCRRHCRNASVKRAPVC